jgi:hypothetical protein
VNREQKRDLVLACLGLIGIVALVALRAASR